MAGALDSDSDLTLMLSASTGDAAGQDLRSVGNAFLQAIDILVIDVLDLICAENANFLSSAVEGTLSGTLSGFGSYFSSLFGLSLNSFVSFVIHSYETSCIKLSWLLPAAQKGSSSSSESSSNLGAPAC